jgi:uncharacterized membrane protein
MSSQEAVAKKKKTKKSPSAKATRSVERVADEAAGGRSSVPAAETKRAPTDTPKPPATSTAAFVEAKKWVFGAAVLLLVGVGLVAIGDTTIGPWLTVGGMATALWGAHRLGRSGPDDAWS